MKPKRKPTGEIPEDCKLPSTVAGIERGRQPTLKQLDLLPDDWMARLRAIKRNEILPGEPRR